MTKRGRLRGSETRRAADAPGLLTTRETAALLAITAATLKDWRHSGRGPRYVKFLGRRRKGPVRYRALDVQQWIESRLLQPERRRNRK
jgi:hypothetical protein